MPCLLNVGSFLILCDVVALQLLLAIAHCIPCSPQSVSSHLISTHLIPCLLNFFTSSHLIPSDVFSPFLICSQLITSVLFSAHVTWAFPMSSHLSAYLSFVRISQLFLTLFSSFQLSAAHVSSSYVVSSLLWILSHHLSSSHTSSAGLSPCQLLNAFSNPLSSSLAQRLLQKRISAPKQATPVLSTETISHKEAFTQPINTASFHTEKPLHSEACTHSKPLHTARTFTHRSPYTGSKLSHKEAFTRRSVYTEKLLHTQASSHKCARKTILKTP